MLEDEDWRVRSGAAVSLGQFGQRAATPLLTALKENTTTLSKSNAFTLRMIGTPETLAALEEYGYEKLTK
jgi:HEAT repeat protein